MGMSLGEVTPGEVTSHRSDTWWGDIHGNDMGGGDIS